jgi:hypothetical protein
MCIYYYLHHHHVTPCTRSVNLYVYWDYCLGAVTDPDGKVTVPCQQTYFDSVQSVDIGDPCATGGCLVSPECASGACRLEDLNGLWVCCQCGRGRNYLTWCRHKMKKCPDTFCYHTVCQDCKVDDMAS